MKKFLLLVQLLFVYTAAQAQSDSYSSNIFTDSPISLSSGHYSFSLPLFDMETSNSQVKLNASLGYHSKSVRSMYSGSMFGNGFSLSILPVISREKATDEGKLPELTVGANGTSERPDVYSYNVFGLNGKFFVYIKNGAIKLQIIEQNAYAEIKVAHDTGSGPFTEALSYGNMYFTIVDKDGTEYIFKTKEKRPYQVSSNPFPRFQNRFLNIYLTNVVDKSKRELLNCTYTDRTVGNNTLKQISEINVLNSGKVRFDILNSNNAVPKVQNIQLFNEFDVLEKTIEFNYTGWHLGTHNLSKITYKTPDNKTYYYQLFYNNVIGTLDENSGYYWPSLPNSAALPYGMTDVSDFAYSGMLSGMASGVLNKVILPTGGSINFTYEANDIQLDENKWFTDIPDNYDFAEIPKIVTTIYRTEGLFIPYVRHSFTISEKAKLFYRVNSDGKSSGGSLPIITYPDYKIYKSTDTSTPILTAKANNTTSYSILVLDPGTYYLEYKDSEKSLFRSVSLKMHTKKTTNLQQFIYAPGIRIKSIVEQDGNKTNETVFHYKPLARINENVSSGYSGYGVTYSKVGLRFQKDKSKEFVYYTTVTKEIKGKGFIEYNYGDKVVNDSLVSIGKFDNLRKYPKQVKQYDANKNLTEEVATDYTFEYIPMEIDASVPYVKPQGILKNQTLNAKNYKENINIGSVNRIVEYSTNFRVPLTETESDAKNGETVKLESTYQKVGKELLLTNYKKTLNNNMLFNKTYNYILKVTPLAEFYQLSSYAEQNSQNETVNSYEVTKTDNNGNVLEYKDHLGIFHSIVWGYNNSKKLFEVTDLRYDQINALVISDLQLYTSSSGTAQFQDPTIISGYYATLRNAHPDKLITTYTYNIGKGLRTVTDPNGRTTFYEYDNFGRLINMKDQEGNLIKTYQYNFINGVN